MDDDYHDDDDDHDDDRSRNVTHKKKCNVPCDGGGGAGQISSKDELLVAGAAARLEETLTFQGSGLLAALRAQWIFFECAYDATPLILSSADLSSGLELKLVTPLILSS